MMLVKAMVLGGQDRVDEGGRNLAERHQPALLPVALEDAAEQLGLELDRVRSVLRASARPGSTRWCRSGETSISTNWPPKLLVRIGEVVQEDDRACRVSAIVAVFAAAGDFAPARRGW